MKKLLAAGALAAGVVGLTACGPGYTTVANNTYCVNEITGQVMPPQYCQVGSSYYNPALYDYWVGNTYGHHYGVGVVIQHNYFTSGRQVSPANTAARKAAGIPVSGSVSNGAKSSTSTKQYSTPAKPQNSPSRPVTGSTSKPNTSTYKPSTSTRSTFGSSGGSSRSSSTFGSSGSSGRSSSSFGSSGGRK